MATAISTKQLLAGGQPRAGHSALRFQPEFELLLACGGCGISTAAPQLDQILSSPLNWNHILKLADSHRLLPALHAALCDRGDVPVSIQLALRARFQTHVHRVLRFSAELARLIRHFQDHKIQVLAHKGPALGQLLYDDPAKRQFGDLDFLVQSRDVPGARRALMELGYEPRLDLSPRQEKDYLRSGYEVVFGLGPEQNLVELQWQIVPRFYAIDFDMEAFFQRSIDLRLDGVHMRMLGNEDLFLVLCVHAAKHQWSQAGMLRDIAAIARRQLDWQWIEAEAQRLGISRILAISLRLAGDLFQSEVPQAQMLANSSDAEKPASAIQARLIRAVEINPESFSYFRAMMLVRERWQDRVRFACRLAITPGVSEWEMMPGIPDVLFPLYRGVRAVRLARRFASRS